MSAKDSLEHAIDEAADRVKGRQKVIAIAPMYGEKLTKGKLGPAGFLPPNVARAQEKKATPRRLAWAAREIAATGGRLAREVAAELDPRAAAQVDERAQAKLHFEALGSLAAMGKVPREYLAAIGRKGGQAGTGAAKVRGDSEHYRELAARRPQWKPDRAITIHANGTVSFFSVLRQTWERRQAAAIGSADLATMPDSDREAIARAAKRHPTPGE